MHRRLELGLIRVHILARAARMPVYGAQLLAELTRQGYELSFGTLYPILHHLEQEGLLTREDRVENGRLRKYYIATQSGHDALLDARELLGEVDRLLGREQATPARVQPDSDPASLLIDFISFRSWYDGARQPRPVLIDVRHTDEYRAGHLPGARLFPYEELPGRLKELERQIPIVTYSMILQEMGPSVNAAALLRGYGFQAWALSGGLAAWINANLPLERGPLGS